MFPVAVLLSELAHEESSILQALGQKSEQHESVEHVFVSPRAQDLVALFWMTGRLTASTAVQTAHLIVIESLPAWMTRGSGFRVDLLEDPRR